MLCENCTKGFRLDGEPTGTMQPDGSYLAAASADGRTEVAIVLLTDVFGLPLKNCKIMADNFAKELAVDVWIPDLFNGNPPVKEADLAPFILPVPGMKLSLLTRARFFLGMIGKLPALIGLRPSVILGRVGPFVENLKKTHGYKKLGAVGYCLGGGIAARGAYLFDSIVVAHPSGIPKDVLQAIKVPSSWVCAEEDMAFSNENRELAQSILTAQKDIPCEFKVWEGTTHGFAARPALEYPKVKEGFEGGFQQSIDWFRKTLHQSQ